MDEQIEVFDFHRIFLGDTPPMFLLEIVFRTLIMYGYTIFLLRILGKRGMGQLSVLELAIIISFGSAIGDPMVGPNMPILHGIVAVTVVAIFQISLERLINRNKKVETFLEGSPNLIVDNGLIIWDCLNKDNLSKEDLFRALRSKDVEHLGQIQKAYFETTGQISVLFHSPRKIQPGLSVIPEMEILASDIFKRPARIETVGMYCCLNCGNRKTYRKTQKVVTCELCKMEEWTKAVT